MKLMKKRQELIVKMVTDNRIRTQKLQVEQAKRAHPSFTGYEKGDLVMFNYQYGSDLQASSRKLISPWIGPVKIQGILDNTHYILSDWQGKCFPVEVEIHRIKPYRMNIYSGKRMMTVTNIYKHLHLIKQQMELHQQEDHVSQQLKSFKMTQTGEN
jgi:hypothetical protein